MTIEQRLARLEPNEAIRQLKHRYLAACDAKDATAMRACFVDGPMHIDYGPVGVFDNADAVAQIFKDLGCQPHIVEMHHGSNPQIEVMDEQHARAIWSLHYQQINTQTQVLTQLGAVYEDEYLLGAQGWRINRTVCRPLSTLVLELGEQAIKALVRGRP